MERSLTIDEADEPLNAVTHFMRRLTTERRICFHHVGHHVRLAEHGLEDFVAAGRVAPSESQWYGDRAKAS